MWKKSNLGIYQLQTQRLLLRQWQTNDFVEFAKMNASEKVMKYFPRLLSQDESYQVAENLAQNIAENGWGFWAIEDKFTGKFIGFTGLKQTPECLSFSPAIEIGWRLSSESWHKGFATEAAKKVIDFAFNELRLTEVVSFTAKINQPSERVMQRIGMINTGLTFQHPLVDKNSPLREHVLYKANGCN